MYRRSTSSIIKHLDFMLGDLACLILSLVVCYGLRNGFSFTFNQELYVNTAIMMVLIDIVVAFFNESYKGIMRRGYWEEYKAVIKHTSLVMVFIIFYLFIIQRGQVYSRTVLVLQWVFSTILMYITRVVWKNHLRSKDASRTGNRSMLVVCAKQDAGEIIRTIRENDFGKIRLSGIILTELNGRTSVIEEIPVVASGWEQALTYIKRNWVDEVFIQLPHGSQEDKNSDRFIQICTEMGVTVHLELARLLNANKQIVENIGGYTVLSTSVNMASVKQVFMKRLLDILGSIVGLFFTAIVTLFVAPIIYIQSPGPIFFSQERVGKNGKHFKLYKFRSMYTNAEERKAELMSMNELATTLMFKMEDDPRIIGGEKGIGGFIRRTSLDEFPQFWNVLKGDMSLVGTRPPTVDEWEQYEFHHRKRMSAKPGITGLWQVSGRSNIKNFEDVVKLDTQYINEWSFGMDLRILAKTVMVVLKRDGSI